MSDSSRSRKRKGYWDSLDTVEKAHRYMWATRDRSDDSLSLSVKKLGTGLGLGPGHCSMWLDKHFKKTGRAFKLKGCQKYFLRNPNGQFPKGTS